MKRAENCENAKLSHISVRDDAIAFEFVKSKGHQDGEEAFGPWHVYCNPFDPTTCCWLAMARYLFAFPEVLKNNSPLFPGNDQYTRYCRIFSKVLEEHKDELKSMGVDPDDLGTHSTRKGVATQVTAGSTVAPPLISVCLRMGWSLLGPVQGRYLKYEKAGDQYVGRAAAGLDTNTKEFAVSSYYFETSVTNGVVNSEEQELQIKENIEKYLKERLLSVGNMNGQTFLLVKGLFAALCYHYDYVDRYLHVRSPLNSSLFFKDLPVGIRQHATICFPWSKTKNSPTITGIPPHVVLLAEMEALKNKFHELNRSLLSGIKNMLDERNIGTPEYYHQEVMRSLQEVQDNLIQKLSSVSSVGLSANQSLTIDDVDMNDAPFDLHDENEDLPEEIEGVEQITATSDATPNAVSRDRILLLEREKRAKTKAVLKKRFLKIGLNNGRLEILTPGYQFPAMTSYELFHNWFIGNQKKNVPPFKVLKAQHLKQIKGGQEQLRKMKVFMKEIEGVTKSLPSITWPTRLSEIKVDDLTRLWGVVGPKVYEKFGRANQARYSELSWRTMYNEMVRYKKKKKDEDTRDG